MSTNLISITRTLCLDINQFPDGISQYLLSRKNWLEEVAAELIKWRLEEDNRDYLLTVNRYFYVFTLPTVELFADDFSSSDKQDLVEANFWISLHIRFADDVLDNDNDGIGFETSLFLSNYCLAQALQLLQRQSQFALNLKSFWDEYHKMYSFQVEMTRPYQKVDFSTFISRHWERGSLLFWMPGQILMHAARNSEKTLELLKCLRGYFDVALASPDIIDLFNDHKHRLNTPATVLLQECENTFGMMTRLRLFGEKYRVWVEKRYLQTVNLTSKYNLNYTEEILKNLWRAFMKLEDFPETRS